MDKFLVCSISQYKKVRVITPKIYLTFLHQIIKRIGSNQYTNLVLQKLDYRIQIKWFLDRNLENKFGFNRIEFEFNPIH